MKFLADMGISTRTLAVLREQGHDALHARDVERARATDAMILERAQVEGRIVLTVDLDFGQLLAASLQATPSVVIFRLRDQTPASITARLLRIIAERSLELELGAIIVVEERRYRLRLLPISH